MSADPKAGLVTPAVSKSLVDAGFVTLEADLTNSIVDSFDDHRKQDFTTLPILVLYPIGGPAVGINGGTPESEIVSTVEQLAQCYF